MKAQLEQATPADRERLVGLMAELRPDFRGVGLGSEAMKVVRAACERLGVRALHLEVERRNARAHALYRRTGFVDNRRQLLTLRLADPVHAE